MRRSPFSLLIAFSFIAPAWGQAPAADPPQPPADEPATTTLTLHPVPEPRPALKYRLLPTPREQRPGNAAVFYNKAALIYAENKKEYAASDEKISKWIERNGNSLVYDLPLEQLPVAESRDELRKWSQVLQTVDEATHRDLCDWQMPFREEPPLFILLPELQTMRVFGRVLAAKARSHVAAGEPEEALAALKTGYTVARHAAAGPTLIHGLVGVAISNIMSQVVIELAQQPTAPNLYWAFRDLPQPLIDFRTAYQYEMDWIYYWHPEWVDIGSQQHGVAEWRRMYDSLVDVLSQLEPRHARENGQWLLAGLAIKGYPRAKRSLIAEGRVPEEVEAMPVAQVLLIHTLHTYDRLRDDSFKWSALPYWQARAGMEQAMQQLKPESARHEVLPLADLTLPAFQAAQRAQALGQRTLQLLTALEALKLYAAGHDGDLPEHLADIHEAPVPHDPMTGEPFHYHLDGEHAVLEAPAPEGTSKEYFGVLFVITIAK